MYFDSAYLNNSLIDIKDRSKPLIVTSCGTYKLYTRSKLPTWRPKGRRDFQLIYIASGKAHFHFGNVENDTIVPAGHIVLYRPKEPQKYEYYGEDKTEVYWVHFTGENVTNILRSYGFKDKKKVFYCGSDIAYQQIFCAMINELQLCRDSYSEMLEMYLRQIFIHLQRRIDMCVRTDNSLAVKTINKAVLYFNEHYNESINIEDYVKKGPFSISWFIRNFKLCTGFTPNQYVLNKRICNAEGLLQNSSYNISEIASMVGYDNPLYFSRIFKKVKGLSPSEYRRGIQE